MVFVVCWNNERLNLISSKLGDIAFESETQDGARACRRIREIKPDKIIFDLGVRPSHSLATAEAIGKTNSVIIFVDGTTENISKAKKIFPNASFVTLQSLSSTCN